MYQQPDKEEVGRPLKFKTVDELKARIEEYIKSCLDYKRDGWGKRIKDVEESTLQDKEVYLMQQVKPFTVTGLAYFLDTTRDVLMDYESGMYDDPNKSAEDNQQFSNTIKKTKQLIYSFAEEQLFVGKNPSGVIFNLKNNWGWKDEQIIRTPDAGESLSDKLKEIDDKLSVVANSKPSHNAG
jgi:hypothetical protein